MSAQSLGMLAARAASVAKGISCFDMVETIQLFRTTGFRVKHYASKEKIFRA